MDAEDFFFFNHEDGKNFKDYLVPTSLPWAELDQAAQRLVVISIF